MDPPCGPRLREEKLTRISVSSYRSVPEAGQGNKVWNSHSFIHYNFSSISSFHHSSFHQGLLCDRIAKVTSLPSRTREAMTDLCRFELWPQS